MLTVIETKSQCKNTELLLELFKKLIAPKRGPDDLNRCPFDYPLQGTITGHEEYLTKFKKSDYGNGLALAGYLIVYQIGHHTGDFHLNGMRLLIIARDFYKREPCDSGLIVIPTAEEVSRLTGKERKVFSDVIATLDLLKNHA